MGTVESEKTELKQRKKVQLNTDDAVKNRERVSKHSEKNSDSEEEEPKKETEEERVARIGQVSVSFTDFVFKCIDYDMLKMFVGSMIGFFCLVLIVTIIYLIFCFFFYERQWELYFPSDKVRMHATSEL